jgi:phage terminase large subunit-like protein
MAGLYGWMGPDGFRRFRTAYIEIGKGNGKSPLAASMGLYGIVGDKETAAEVYCCATKKDQAKQTLFREAELMVQNSPWLRERLQVNRDNIAHEKSGSFFRLISSETQGVDGPRPHMFIADEVHELPNATLIDKLRAGFKGRRQPLGVEITNSGDDKRSVCYAHHEYSGKVLRGVTPNDTWFAFVCGLDPCEKCKTEGKEQPSDDCDQCDDWKDESVWPKANPNLGISIPLKYLRELVAEALGMPSKENIVRRLNFCQWVEGADRWLSVDMWDACKEDYSDADLLHQLCYGGLDLSSTLDLTAFLLYFPNARRVLAWFWVPKENVKRRVKLDRVPYDIWIRKKFIKATPGNVIDYDFIREDIKKLGEKFQIKEIGFDPWNATQLGTQLTTEGFEMVSMPQKMSHLAAPTKELETMIVGKKIHHDGNPVLRWCMSNVAVASDASGNSRPDKENSSERIDGAVALVDAIGRAIVHGDTGDSVYETRGVFSV